MHASLLCSSSTMAVTTSLLCSVFALDAFLLFSVLILFVLCSCYTAHTSVPRNMGAAVLVHT